MKKKIIAFLFVLLLSVTAAVPTFALDDSARLVDEANLLTDSEAQEVASKLDEISERQNMDIVIVTVDSIGDSTPKGYAADYYDYHSYRADGVILLISMEERDWSIVTTGYGITALTDAGQAYISDRFVGDLSDGDYAAAFMTFANCCDEFITQAKNGNPYDVNNLPKEPFALVKNLLIALAVGLVLALIITGVMKGKLKTVRFQPAANSYVKNGSMQIAQSSDLFLYSHVDRREKPKQNSSSGGSSTFTSSSGTTHGGSSGKF